MSHVKDLTGQKFERLTAIERDYAPQNTNRKRTKWICKCECGNIVSVVSTDLLSGHTKSCGCYHKDQARNFLSGIKKKSQNYHLSKTKTYRIWKAMMQRCSKENCWAFKYYGGRGIKVCNRWHDYKNFLHDMGSAPDNGSIDRINVDGNYEPDNCRWITMKQQNNNRRSCIYVEYDGHRLSLKAFAEKYDLSYSRVRSLYHNGKSCDKILKTLKG